MSKTVKIPGPDHPIAITRVNQRVEVKLGGVLIASSADALVLKEAAYPPVYYIPRRDVNMALLERTDHATYCPYKGDCAYYSIPSGGERSVNAAWTYEEPYTAVDSIKGHLAFYPDRVDSLTTR